MRFRGRLPLDYAARNLGRSRARMAMSIGGSTLVVLILITAAAFVRGMSASIRATGSEHNVILLGAGSEESIERSEIEASVPSIVEASLDVLRDRAGVVYVSPEVHVQLPVKSEKGDAAHPILLRGVTSRAMMVHDQAQIVEGRFPDAGSDEVMMGRMAAATLELREDEAALGRKLLIDGRSWTIVGRFAAPGTAMDAEVWAPLAPLMHATKRNTISCAVVSVDPELGEVADVETLVKTRPDLELSAIGETRYYADLARFFGPIRAVAWVTAVLISLGGLLGGLNTMYAAFASRVREIGMLRALGFRRRAIVLSLVQESLIATTVGALAAAAIGVFALDGLAVRFSLGAFGLMVDEVVVAIGLVAGLGLGVVGAVPPAIRCLRLTIPAALKSA